MMVRGKSEVSEAFRSLKALEPVQLSQDATLSMTQLSEDAREAVLLHLPADALGGVLAVSHEWRTSAQRRRLTATIEKCEETLHKLQYQYCAQRDAL